MNKIIPNMGIAHLALKASDFEKSIEFYKALGMEPYLNWGEGDKRIQIENDPGEYAGKYTHFAYEVEDVQAAFDVAIAAGAKPKILPKVVPLDSHPEKVSLNIAFVYGPDGEELEFFKFV